MSASPAPSSVAPQQATAAPQTQATSSAPAPAPRNVLRRFLHEPGVWIGIGLAIAAVIVAVYYGAVMLAYAKWTKRNDFREGCIHDQEHKLPLSAACSEELLRPRVSMVKRQVEGAHSAFFGEHTICFAGAKFAASFASGFAVCAGLNWLPKRDWKNFKSRALTFIHGLFIVLLLLIQLAQVIGCLMLGTRAIVPLLALCALQWLWNTLRGSTLVDGLFVTLSWIPNFAWLIFCFILGPEALVYLYVLCALLIIWTLCSSLGYFMFGR